MSTATIAMPVRPPGVVTRAVRKSILFWRISKQTRVKAISEKLYAIAAGNILVVRLLRRSHCPDKHIGYERL